MRRVLGPILTAILLLSSPVLSSPARAVSPDTCVRGIDISHYQGQVDWAQVANSGIVFAYAQATQGKTFTDSNFASNWAAMGASGIRRGAYHYFVTDDPWQDQLAHFTATVTLARGDLPPMVDAEKFNGEARDTTVKQNLASFLDGLEKHYGVAPIIYTNNPFWDDDVDKSLGGYLLWIAEYGVDAPRVPVGWSTWTLWQYSQSGSVDGVTGDVDLDCFVGDASALDALRIQ